jgi:hypothetical protein
MQQDFVKDDTKLTRHNVCLLRCSQTKACQYSGRSVSIAVGLLACGLEAGGARSFAAIFSRKPEHLMPFSDEEADPLQHAK